MKNLVKKRDFLVSLENHSFSTRFFTHFHLFQPQNQREKLICVLRQKNPLRFPIYPIENSYFYHVLLKQQQLIKQGNKTSVMLMFT